VTIFAIILENALRKKSGEANAPASAPQQIILHHTSSPMIGISSRWPFSDFGDSTGKIVIGS